MRKMLRLTPEERLRRAHEVVESMLEIWDEGFLS